MTNNNLRTAKYIVEVKLPNHITQDQFRTMLEHSLSTANIEFVKVRIMRNRRHNHHSAKTAQRSLER